MDHPFTRFAALACSFLIAASANAGVVATNTNYGNLDGRESTRALDVPTRGKISDLNIIIDFAKCDDPPIGPNGSACIGSGSPFENEFSMRLISPDGTTVDLIRAFNTYRAGASGSGVGRVSVGFDDEAANAAGPRIGAGSFRPAGALSAFDGMDAFGSWTLYMRDFSSGDPLEFFSAQLEMTVDAPAPMPEPASLAMLGLGLLALRATRRR